MIFLLGFFLSTFLCYLPAFVAGFGTQCHTLVNTGQSGPNDPFWMQNIKHQGISPFNPSGNYSVFRNVKDFGAVGDGVTDDTAAINAAISSGNRCGSGTCPSSTVSPAIVYFPQGTYLVSTPIIAYYYTQLIGDAKHPPTLLATANFNGIAVIDADPYIATGQFYQNQNNFFRSVRNFVIDVRNVPPQTSGTGIHWQVAQATSLMNIVVQMSTAPNNVHQGIWMENGSGGYMGDLVFNGGKFGMWVGNQQFTVRNITVNNAQTGVFSVWNWGWTYQGVKFNNCQVGFDVQNGGSTSALAIIDGSIQNTPIFLRRSTAPNNTIDGTIVLNNIRLNNVTTAVGVVGGEVLLQGGTTTIASWGQGNIFTGSNSNGTFTPGGSIPAGNKSPALLDSSGKIVGKTHPQYETYLASQFVSVRDQGAKGDGVTDDTAALQAVFNKFSGCKIIFIDAGFYVITSTLIIPAGTQVVGEAWSVLAGKGSAFEDQNNPQVVVKVGEKGSVGITEITDILFTTVGPTPGAIIVEWNVAEPSYAPAGAGMWDSHIRTGGAAGSNLELAQCPNTTVITNSSACFSSFLDLHLTTSSTAYLEGTWIWVADHDIDGDGVSQLTIFGGRGVLSESQGPVWMIGTASEHHVLYQYNLANANNHYMGLIQTETPYFQPTPPAPSPFSTTSVYHDPTQSSSSAWALNVQNSHNILVFGAALYSFYNNYTQTCLSNSSCQDEIVNIDSQSSVSIYSMTTVGVTTQLSIDGSEVISASSNANGFPSTLTVWTNCGW